MTSHNLDATVFVYSNKKTGEIRCEYIDNARVLEEDELWFHEATLEPRMFIQHHWKTIEQNRNDSPDGD